MKINYRNIPVLAICFTHSTDFIGTAIRFFRGNLKDRNFPNHAFLVTEDHGQLFATEQTLGGLKENSLEEYTEPDNKIVSVYTWIGFNDPAKRETAQQYLAEIRRRHGENSEYDVNGILSFLPVFKWFYKPDPKKQWCSENVASILKIYGCDLIKDSRLTPDQLEPLLKNHPEQFAVREGFYI